MLSQMNDISSRIKTLKTRVGTNHDNRKIKRKQVKNTFEYAPFSKKQIMVMSWWAPESPVKDKNGIIADGSIRSGKSTSMSLSYVLWAMKSFNQQNFGMAGKTIASFRRNVLTQLKLMLRGRGYKVKEHRADNMFEVTKENVRNYFYIFGGKDESSQDLIQGITLAGMFFDEVALMPESFVNQATGRCSVEGSKWWFNCNPDNPKHWFNEKWIKKCRERGLLYVHFTMDDNLSLDEKIKERYRQQYTGVFYKRYILGFWAVADGLVYSMFDEDKHIVRGDYPPAREYYVSIDYGTVNPFSAGLWGFDGRTAVRQREVYYSGRDSGIRKDDEAYYQMLEEMIGDREIEYIIIDPSAASFIETIRKHGKYLVKGADNDVLDGIRVTTTFLNSGKIKIHESCKNCIEEFGLYSWDEDSKGDKIVKQYDHSMDDMRYFCNTFLRRRLRWEF